MWKNALFLVVVVAILLILTSLFLHFGNMKHQRERELARLTGNDEQSRIIRNELSEYRTLNETQQRGILAVGLVVILAALMWWGRQFKGLRS